MRRSRWSGDAYSRHRSPDYAQKFRSGYASMRRVISMPTSGAAVRFRAPCANPPPGLNPGGTVFGHPGEAWGYAVGAGAKFVNFLLPAIPSKARSASAMAQ